MKSMIFEAKVWKGASKARLLVVPKKLREEFIDKFGSLEKVNVIVNDYATPETTTTDPA